jgi:hypothetical protein
MAFRSTEQLCETKHTNKDMQVSVCQRCHKPIREMATFYRWRGLIIGPECIDHAKEDGKNVKRDRLLAVIREKFILQKRLDTVAGMKRLGLL